MGLAMVNKAGTLCSSGSEVMRQSQQSVMRQLATLQRRWRWFAHLFQSCSRAGEQENQTAISIDTDTKSPNLYNKDHKSFR